MPDRAYYLDESERMADIRKKCEGHMADVLSVLGECRRDGQLLVGFAAETSEAGLERARDKLTRKGADLFVLNDVSRPDIGFDASENEVTLLGASGERTVAKAPKEEIAAAILDEVEKLIRNG